MATRTWTGLSGTTSNWSDAANWDTGVPVAADALVFAGTNRPITNNDLTPDTSFASITVNAGAAAFTLGGNRITYTGSISQNSTNLLTIGLDIILTGNRTIQGSGPTTITGVLSGTGGLVCNLSGSGSAGDLTLLALNTYTGQTQINNGQLVANTLLNVGAGPSSLGAPTTVAAGTIKLGNAGNTGELYYTGPTTSTDRVINLGGTTSGGVILNNGSGLLTFTATSFTATGAGSKPFTLGGTADLVFNGAIVNNSVTNITRFIKSGANTVTLNSVCTYTGTTVISGGILKMGVNNAIDSTSVWTLTSTLDLSGFSLNIGNLSGAGTATNTGALSTLTIQVGTFSGVISGPLNVTKTGTGNLTLSGTSSTYSGVTTLSSGSLTIATIGNVSGSASSVGIPSSVPNGTIDISTTPGSSCQFLVTTSCSTDRNFTLSGAGTSSAYITANPSVTFSCSGTISGATVNTYRVQLGAGSGGSSTFSGVISNGSGTLGVDMSPSGNAILTLSNANTYTGSTRVFGSGIINITGSITSDVTWLIAPNASLAGNGTITGNVSPDTFGGILVPGAAGTSPGTLTVTGTATLDSAMTYKAVLANATPTLGKLAANGAITVAGALTVQSVSSPVQGTVYTILTSATSLTGTFTGKPDGTVFNSGGRWFRINYTATDVTLTDVIAPRAHRFLPFFG